MNLARPKKVHSIHRILALSLIALIFSSLESISVVAMCVASATSSHSPFMGQNSWALGIMVPDHTRFEDGSNLSWIQARNVSVVAQLPEVNHTDGAILAVLSLMLQDGSVLQLAAGLYPKEGNSWLAYGWLIADMNSYRQVYDWVLNASQPRIMPGALVTLSIYLSPNGWSYHIIDLDTGENNAGLFSAKEDSLLASGDQEVFALESYSFENFVFEDMQNLTLRSILVGGQEISSGWYFYSGWDSAHNPLFVVGSTSSPSFISVKTLNGGTITWSYDEQWTGHSVEIPRWFIMLIILTLPPGSLISLVLIIERVRKGSEP